MTELIPCSECKTIFEAKDHFCFKCYGHACTRLSEEKEKNEQLSAQILGLNQTVRRLLKANSQLCQPEMDLR